MDDGWARFSGRRVVKKSLNGEVRNERNFIWDVGKVRMSVDIGKCIGRGREGWGKWYLLC